eukprot:358772-Chlamydomonas_euryale.AAC.13
MHLSRARKGKIVVVVTAAPGDDIHLTLCPAAQSELRPRTPSTHSLDFNRIGNTSHEYYTFSTPTHFSQHVHPSSPRTSACTHQ